MFELMHQNGDYTHFYFCYRWFLLDFKRGESYHSVCIVLIQHYVREVKYILRHACCGAAFPDSDIDGREIFWDKTLWDGFTQIIYQ
jgi:hypothetical protein